MKKRKKAKVVQAVKVAKVTPNTGVVIRRSPLDAKKALENRIKREQIALANLDAMLATPDTALFSIEEVRKELRTEAVDLNAMLERVEALQLDTQILFREVGSRLKTTIERLNILAEDEDTLTLLAVEGMFPGSDEFEKEVTVDLTRATNGQHLHRVAVTVEE